MTKDECITNAIATRILKLCEEKQVSINQLAQKSILTQSTIQNIVTRKSKNPKLRTIILIC